MGNGERSGSGSWSDWRVRLATMAGAGAGGAIALLSRPALGGYWGLWPGMIGFGVVTGVGAVLGRLVGGMLFRASIGGPPDQPPHV